jgi:hypothetical protein
MAIAAECHASSPSTTPTEAVRCLSDATINPHRIDIVKLACPIKASWQDNIAAYHLSEPFFLS